MSWHFCSTGFSAHCSCREGGPMLYSVAKSTATAQQHQVVVLACLSCIIMPSSVLLAHAHLPPLPYPYPLRWVQDMCCAPGLFSCTSRLGLALLAKVALNASCLVGWLFKYLPTEQLVVQPTTSLPLGRTYGCTLTKTPARHSPCNAGAAPCWYLYPFDCCKRAGRSRLGFPANHTKVG